MKRIVLIAAASAALAACTSSGGGDTVMAIPSDVSAVAYVQDVALASPPATAGEGFENLFETRVAQKLKTCTRGTTRPLRLEAEIVEFKRANPALTYLVGSSNSIRGTARLVDPATGEKVADFDISRSVGGGGLIAAAAMAQAEEQMSDAFADEICKRAFIAR